VDGREVRIPAFAVDCVDSTGAGDAFAGAYLGNRLLKKVTLRTVQITVTIMIFILSIALGLGLV
jgi:sugar/nucleoside kinase (ribokinase family)